MENNIDIFVHLHLNDVELSVAVTDSLKKQEGNLKNFGYIQITDGSNEDKPIFWDGINFFLECGKKEFKEECKKQLKKKNYNWKETYKEIKTLLKKAVELELLTNEINNTH